MAYRKYNVMTCMAEMRSGTQHSSPVNILVGGGGTSLGLLADVLDVRDHLTQPGGLRTYVGNKHGRTLIEYGFKGPRGFWFWGPHVYFTRGRRVYFILLLMEYELRRNLNMIILLGYNRVFFAQVVRYLIRKLSLSPSK